MVSKAVEVANWVFNHSANDGPWEKFKLSPASRFLTPSKIYNHEGLINNAEGLTDESSETITTLLPNSLVTLEFDLNTCGQIHIEFAEGEGELHLSFAESKLFISKETSDRSMDFFIEDGVETIKVQGESKYVTPWKRQRGGFKYLTMFTKELSTPIKIITVKTYMTNMPSLGENLRNYSGFFYCDDNFLNQIWYACAYTIQLGTIPSNSARRHDVVMPTKGWSNNEVGCTGIEFLTDGARRDRSIWSGDRSVTVPAEACCFNSATIKNSTDWIMDEQLESGEFPYACRPIATYGSDTYHLWTLISVWNTWRLHGGLDDWLQGYKDQWLKAIDYSIRKIDDTGLLKVTFGLDWGRNMLKGHSMSANCLLYRVIVLTFDLFDLPSSKRKEFTALSSNLKDVINGKLWDEAKGMYKDNLESDVYPQDGNSLAIIFDIASKEQSDKISLNLKNRWTKFGAPAPESPGMHSPFITGFELQAHVHSGNTQRAIDLIRLMWGYIWNAPYGVKSSLIEGYFQDGSCKYPFQLYDPSYISHAHPWSCGPIITLTNHIMGLSFEPKLNHNTWIFKPKFADLNYAVGSIKSPTTGEITAGWCVGNKRVEFFTKSQVNGSFLVDLSSIVPEGSKSITLRQNDKPVELQDVTRNIDPKGVACFKNWVLEYTIKSGESTLKIEFV